MCLHTNICSHANTPTDVHKYADVHTRTHTHTRMDACMHRHTHTHTHTHVDACTHRHTCTHSHTYAHGCMYLCAHTHTHTHAYTHAHPTQTPTCSSELQPTLKAIECDAGAQQQGRSSSERTSPATHTSSPVMAAAGATVGGMVGAATALEGAHAGERWQVLVYCRGGCICGEVGCS